MSKHSATAVLGKYEVAQAAQQGVYDAIPKGDLRQLSALPDDHRAQIYEEATKRGNLSPKHYRELDNQRQQESLAAREKDERRRGLRKFVQRTVAVAALAGAAFGIGKVYTNHEVAQAAHYAADQAKISKNLTQSPIC